MKIEPNILSSTQEGQEWLLNCLPSVIKLLQFYFRLKEGLISEEQYQVAKKLYLNLKMGNLGKLNKLYNFHTIILPEIFESKATYLNKILIHENVILPVLSVNVFIKI